MRQANYDKFPHVQVEGENSSCITGWQAIGKKLNDEISSGKKIIVVECYQGILENELVSNLKATVKHDLFSVSTCTKGNLS